MRVIRPDGQSAEIEGSSLYNKTEEAYLQAFPHRLKWLAAWKLSTAHEYPIRRLAAIFERHKGTISRWIRRVAADLSKIGRAILASCALLA